MSIFERFEMMRSQTVAARDASVPLRVTDRVRILPHSNRDVLLGTARVTILVALKNRWGSVATLLDHDRVAVNFDVRENEIESRSSYHQLARRDCSQDRSHCLT